MQICHTGGEGCPWVRIYLLQGRGEADCHPVQEPTVAGVAGRADEVKTPLWQLGLAQGNRREPVT
jgi:hypothetical protein